MRYFVTLGEGEPIAVDVLELPSGALDVRVNERVLDVDVVDVAGAAGAVSVRVDGRVVDLTVEGAPPDVGIVASGHRSYVKVESARLRAALAAKKPGGQGAEKLLKSPMPGRVVKVLVAAGDEVAAGQALLVIEAMKMETEVRAKGPGVVKELFVVAGTPVEASARLIAFT